jgi:hypothetical protein
VPVQDSTISHLSGWFNNVSALATNIPWCISNRQIHKDLGNEFFANHIAALTKSNSNSADAGNPFVQ